MVNPSPATQVSWFLTSLGVVAGSTKHPKQGRHAWPCLSAETGVNVAPKNRVAEISDLAMGVDGTSLCSGTRLRESCWCRVLTNRLGLLYWRWTHESLSDLYSGSPTAQYSKEKVFSIQNRSQMGARMPYSYIYCTK